MELFSFVFQLLITLFAIDFVSGLVHWCEDTFGTENSPVTGKWIVIPNMIHHENPAAFLSKSWLESSWDLTVASLLIAFSGWLAGELHWQLMLFCFIGANANQLHKYAHLPENKVPLFIRFLRHTGILQTARHHARHHSGEKNTAYCVVTPYLNPVLDSVKFWRFLEMITVPLFGAPRREDLRPRN